MKKRTSDILQGILDSPDHGEITVGDFVAKLGERSFALIILIFSLPNALPLPGIPGVSTVTGLPIMFIAMQMIWGRNAIWLPRKLAEKKFHQAMMTKIIGKALPSVLWLEKLLHPRMTALCTSYGERLIGLLIVLMAVILALPILGGNFLPGFCISLLALALLENDGFFAAISIAITLAGFVLMYQVIALVFTGVMHGIGLA